MLDQPFRAPQVPLISDAQVAEFHASLINFFKALIAQGRLSGAGVRDCETALAHLEATQAAGAFVTTDGQKRLIQSMLITLLIGTRVPAFEFAREIGNYFTAYHLAGMNDNMTAIFAAISNGQGPIAQIVQARKADGEVKGDYLDLLVAALTREHFQDNTVAEIPFALCSGALGIGGGYNCGFHAIIHTFMKDLFNLAPHQIRAERNRAGSPLDRILNLFFDAHPELPRTEEALIAFNREHHTPADQEMIWGDILRVITGTAPNIFMESDQLGALVASMGGDFELYNRQGELMQASRAKNPNGLVARAVFNMKGNNHTNGNHQNHYDALLPTQHAMNAHNAQMRPQDLAKGLSGLLRQLKLDRADKAYLQQVDVSDQELEQRILGHLRAMHAAKGAAAADPLVPGHAVLYDYLMKVRDLRMLLKATAASIPKVGVAAAIAAHPVPVQEAKWDIDSAWVKEDQQVRQRLFKKR
jgi:hypothetical protein